MTNQQELTYLKRVIDGDSEAFSYFVDTYQHMAFTLAFRIVQNREEAEDIVQEAFVKCFHKLHCFKGDSKFSTWLYRIVYHRALDAIRKQKRSIDTQEIDLEYFDSISQVSSVLDQMMEEQAKEVIKTAIQTLNEKQQTIITLYYYDCLSLKEIAEVIAISVAAVKVHLHRARKKLYVVLKDHTEFENKTL